MPKALIKARVYHDAEPAIPGQKTIRHARRDLPMVNPCWSFHAFAPSFPPSSCPKLGAFLRSVWAKSEHGVRAGRVTHDDLVASRPSRAPAQSMLKSFPGPLKVQTDGGGWTQSQKAKRSHSRAVCSTRAAPMRAVTRHPLGKPPPSSSPSTRTCHAAPRRRPALLRWGVCVSILSLIALQRHIKEMEM